MSFSNDIPSLQNQLPLSIQFSSDINELTQELNDVYQTIASALNNKVGGLYVPLEKINSQQYFDASNIQNYKNVYRMVVDFGALPNNGTKNIAHNITGWNSNFRLTQCYGAATDPIGLKGIPLANDGILLSVDSINVIVTTTSDFSSYTSCVIVIEYTKN